jgi:hypothetical protein
LLRKGKLRLASHAPARQHPIFKCICSCSIFA